MTPIRDLTVRIDTDDDGNLRSVTVISDVQVAEIGKAVCTAKSLNVRSGPGTEYPVVADLVKGQQVTVLERFNGWSKIAEPAGWCSSPWLVP